MQQNHKNEKEENGYEPKTKNEITFVDDAKGKHWGEMKPEMVMMVDGQGMVTWNLTACSRKSCVFRYITLLEV